MSENTSPKSSPPGEEEWARLFAELEAREKALEEKEKAVRSNKGLRAALYEHIDLSLRTVDTVIVVCAFLIAVLLCVGIFRR